MSVVSVCDKLQVFSPYHLQFSEKFLDGKIVLADRGEAGELGH